LKVYPKPSWYHHDIVTKNQERGIWQKVFIVCRLGGRTAETIFIIVRKSEFITSSQVCWMSVVLLLFVVSKLPLLFSLLLLYYTSAKVSPEKIIIFDNRFSWKERRRSLWPDATRMKIMEPKFLGWMSFSSLLWIRQSMASLNFHYSNFLKNISYYKWNRNMIKFDNFWKQKNLKRWKIINFSYELVKMSWVFFKGLIYVYKKM